MSKVLLVVSGSIAAYKSVDILRELQKRGSEVRVVMTPSATEFIGKLTFESLSGFPVLSSWSDEDDSKGINHIELADWAEKIIVAPASATTISKIAAGSADNVATACILASKAQKTIAPAMNVNMWENPATEQNIATLRERGFTVVEPESGELACGWVGKGRLASTQAIIGHLDYPLEVIVVAGATREYLDPIRFISNKSSGKTGVSLAKSFLAKGCKTTLFACNISADIANISIETSEELYQKLDQFLRTPASFPRLVVMCAAVCDFTPPERSLEKIKKSNAKKFRLELSCSKDILKSLSENKQDYETVSGQPLKLVGFAAETGNDEQVLGYAKGKLDTKGADIIIANNAEEVMGQDTSRAWVLGPGLEYYLPTADKVTNSGLIVDKIIETICN